MQEPQPGIGDVLLDVKAASFTPTELQWPSTWVDRAGKPRTPAVPGHEVAGTVRALGRGTTGLSVGDAVYGITDWYRDGAAAELIAVEARDLAHKPASVSFAEAAALALPGLTAWQALFVHANVGANQSVLVNGASGGVGTLAVQLAHSAGARVIAVAHEWARPLLEQLGASEVVDPANLQAVEDADMLFDLVGGELAAQCAAKVRAGGKVVSAVDPPERTPPSVESVFFVVEPDRPQLMRLAQMVDHGELRPLVGKTLSLEEAADLAFAVKQHGGVPGKVVIEVAS